LKVQLLELIEGDLKGKRDGLEVVWKIRIEID
jgi:hypothetical protein